VDGPKRRVRSETFADHYSQARQFYISQTEVEQGHIVSALTFELSKVETLAIRERRVSHLLNIDDDLANKVAQGLRLKKMPEKADAAKPTRMDLAPSPALSILKNQKPTLKGRKVGCLVSDGVDGKLISALRSAIKAEGGMLKLVAPRVGGIETSQGEWLEGDEKIDGGPSVLFDAVVIAVSEQVATQLANEATARDFVADAYAHVKYIGYVPEARPLLDKAGVPENGDEGMIRLSAGDSDVANFITAAKNLRFWPREAKVKQF
jgi:catalase